MAWDFLLLGHTESALSFGGIGVITAAFLLLVFFSNGGERLLKEGLTKLRRQAAACNAAVNKLTQPPPQCPPACISECVSVLAGKSTKTSEMV